MAFQKASKGWLQFWKSSKAWHDPCLREIIDDADIFLEDLLGMEDGTAAVGGNIELREPSFR